MPIPAVRTQSTNNLSLETLPDRARPISANYTRSSTTVTVASAAHGLTTGREIEVLSATDPGILSGNFPIRWPSITATGASNFTFQTTAAGSGMGNLTYIGNVDVDQLDSDPSIPA
jgi:hypothetical protein